tara:strand:- start:378 stop:713 length:336 start_codon:yes stop_codon:yes gene_type:complete
MPQHQTTAQPSRLTNHRALTPLASRPQTDLHYGLDGFNTKYATRAPKLFSSEDHFHERLFEHESSLPEEKVQVYVVSLAPGVHPDLEMRKQLEDTAKGARRTACPSHAQLR